MDLLLVVLDPQGIEEHFQSIHHLLLMLSQQLLRILAKEDKSDGLLPLNGMRLKKLPGSGGFLVVDVECTGVAKVGPNTKVTRCSACSEGFKCKRQVIRRSQQS